VNDPILDPTNRLHADYTNAGRARRQLAGSAEAKEGVDEQSEEHWQRAKQLHPDLDPTQLDLDHIEQDRVGTSNIWWTLVDGTRNMPQLPKWLVKACFTEVPEATAEVGVSEIVPPRPNARTMKRLNLAQIDLLTQRYLAGKTVHELGAEFGIARQTVSLVLRRNGVPMRMQGLREDQRDEITTLRDQGWSYARLGERFKVDPWTVRNFLVRGATQA